MFSCESVCQEPSSIQGLCSLTIVLSGGGASNLIRSSLSAASDPTNACTLHMKGG